MIAKLKPQLQDRIREIENDQMSGEQKQAELDRFQGLVDGLHEKTDALKGTEGNEARAEYVKEIDELFGKLKSAKPKKETDEKNEQIVAPSSPDPAPENPPAPENNKKDASKKKH